MLRFPLSLLAASALVAGIALGCGAKQPPSAWGYSAWLPRYGPSDMGNFERQQQACKQQAGGTAGIDENAYLQCMNDNGWCTMEFHCEPPTNYPTPGG